MINGLKRVVKRYTEDSSKDAMDAKLPETGSTPPPPSQLAPSARQEDFRALAFFAFVAIVPNYESGE
eukprot:1495922-Pyramimonas_sp.AAC.1